MNHGAKVRVTRRSMLTPSASFPSLDCCTDFGETSSGKYNIKCSFWDLILLGKR